MNFLTGCLKMPCLGRGPTGAPGPGAFLSVVHALGPCVSRPPHTPQRRLWLSFTRRGPEVDFRGGQLFPCEDGPAPGQPPTGWCLVTSGV